VSPPRRESSGCAIQRRPTTVGAYSALSRDALEGAHLAVETVNTDPSFSFALTAHYADQEGVADRYPALAGQLMREACCQPLSARAGSVPHGRPPPSQSSAGGSEPVAVVQTIHRGSDFSSH
jgi:hypothetical protein